MYSHAHHILSSTSSVESEPRQAGVERSELATRSASRAMQALLAIRHQAAPTPR